MFQNNVINVVVITDTIPDSCRDCCCSEQLCNLPMKSYPRQDEFKKIYLTKRHKDCPLRLERRKQKRDL